MEKENWIEEVFNSTNGMTKLIPSEMLFSKIENRIYMQSNISKQWIFAVAASFVILFSINFKIIFSKSKNTVDSEKIASTISKSNQLY